MAESPCGRPASWVIRPAMGLRARMIADAAWGVDPVGFADLHVAQAGAGEIVFILEPSEGAGDAAGPLLHVVPGFGVHVRGRR